MVLLKYLSTFLGILNIPSVNCKINIILTLSANCFISDTGNHATTFARTDTKLYVPVVNLSTQDNGNYCNN